MGKTITTIKIDEGVRDYAKIAAKRKNYTFPAYCEDLFLHDLVINHPDLYGKYINSVPIELFKRITDTIEYLKTPAAKKEVAHDMLLGDVQYEQV